MPSTRGVTFLDIAAIRGLIESEMADASTAEERAEYEESIKPFLDAVRRAHRRRATVGGSSTETHTLITVK